MPIIHKYSPPPTAAAENKKARREVLREEDVSSRSESNITDSFSSLKLTAASGHAAHGFSRNCFKRQKYSEDRAAQGRFLICTQLKSAAVAFSNFFAHPESQACAYVLLGGEKWLKDADAVLRCYARTTIRYANLYTFAFRAGGWLNRDPDSTTLANGICGV